MRILLDTQVLLSWLMMSQRSLIEAVS